MATGDLVSLAVVKDWLEVTDNDQDARIARLIKQITRETFDWLQRSTWLSRTYTDVRDGRRGQSIFLPQWPVTSVASVVIDTAVIPASSSGSAGWILQAWDGYPPGIIQSVDLIGYGVCAGKGNVQVTYTAGYLVSGEAQTVPSTAPYQVLVDQGQGPWGEDAGVTYPDGTALEKVSGTPSAGQYALGGSDDAVGTYIFAAADADAAVLISYSYVPSALEDAALNWIGERYKRRERIGVRSKSLGGQETVSYDLAAMPDYIKTALQPYRKVLPIT